MLIAATDDDFASLLDESPRRGLAPPPGGLETPPVLLMLRALARTVRAEFSPAAWLIVEDDEIVGLCSLKHAPDADGAVEIGYGVAASRRGRGLAQRAVAEVLAWARSDFRIRAVTAETSVDNGPSQRVLERNGFARVGERTDSEDGNLVCWRASVAG
jgi:RimJ/RimL family protein N-acetyltransferase